MATKSVFQEFDVNALAQYSLGSNSERFGLLSRGVVNEVIITEDKTSVDSMYDIIKTPTIKTLKKGNYKKAFVIPGCEVSADRLKQSLKDHGISMTNDYEIADLIITHDNLHKSFENGDNITTNVLFGTMWNYEAYDMSNSGSLLSVSNPNNVPVIYTPAVADKVNRYNLDNEVSLYDVAYLTGMGCNLAYRIGTEGLAVVDTDTVLHESASLTVLDEELLRTLQGCLESYNDENLAMAAKMIPTLDYTKNYHLLWRLADSLWSYSHKFSRDKDVNYWMEKANISRLRDLSAEGMIKWLDKRDLLDTTTFRYLEPICRKEIYISNRELYVFQCQVRPEYRKYLKHSTNE